MSITSILSDIGYSEEFINIIESSLIDDSFGNDGVQAIDQVSIAYDGVSCFIEESASPVQYGEFSYKGE